jgi:hypothetical protein
MFLPEIQHLPNFFKYFLPISAALRGGIPCKSGEGSDPGKYLFLQAMMLKTRAEMALECTF